MSNEIAEQYFSKPELMKLISEYLLQEQFYQIDHIHSYVEQYLRDNRVIGEMVDAQPMMRTSYNRRISNEDALLINECIYDLIFERALTPGFNRDSLELPFIHLSNKDVLNKYL